MSSHDAAGIVLTQMEISPFCDKVRRVLHYKRVPFATREVQIARLGRLRKLAPPGKVPILDCGTERIWDSTDICLWLEQRYPEPALLPSDPALRADVLLLEDWADESLYFFEMTMRFVWKDEQRYWSRELTKHDSGPVRALSPYLVPRLTGTITRHQGLARKDRGQILRDLRRLFSALDTRVSPRGFCVGDRLTLADIAAAAQIHCITGIQAGRDVLAEYPALAQWKQRVDEATLP